MNTCGNCQVKIRESDINRTTGIYFCEYCNGFFKIGEVFVKKTHLTSSSKPRETKVFMSISAKDIKVEIPAKGSGSSLGIMFLIFGLFWFGLGAYATIDVFFNEHPRTQVNGPPHLVLVPLIIGVGLLVAALYNMTKHEVIVVDSEKVVQIIKALLYKKRVEFTGEIEDVEEKVTSKVNDSPRYGIAIHYVNGVDTVFAKQLSEKERKWIIYSIKKFVIDNRNGSYL